MVTADKATEQGGREMSKNKKQEQKQEATKPEDTKKYGKKKKLQDFPNAGEYYDYMAEYFLTKKEEYDKGHEQRKTKKRKRAEGAVKKLLRLKDDPEVADILARLAADAEKE
jgi:hypothetical protein